MGDKIKEGDTFILVKYEYWTDKDFASLGKEYVCKKVDVDGDIWFDTDSTPGDYGYFMSSGCCQKVSNV